MKTESKNKQGKPINDHSLGRRVTNQIRDMIVLDELRPGERLRERDLAESLGVSRTPMREAFKDLAAEGLVELLPNRGAVVAGFSANEIEEKLLVLAVLEQLAGELACNHASEEDISEIRALHHEMLAAFNRGNRKSYFKFNQDIHLHIVKSGGNKSLIETHGRLNTQLYRVRYLSNLRNARWHTALEEHEAILAALESREGKKLGQLMRTHLRSTWFKFSELQDDPRIATHDRKDSRSK